MTQWQEFCFALGIKRMPEYLKGIYSRRFLTLDFLSGGYLRKELYRIHECLGRACNNHDRVWLPDYPGAMEFLRRGKTEAEIHDLLIKNLNDAKGVLIKNIYQM